MPRVICTLINAADTISGITFHATDEGKISDFVDHATADRLATIPGYRKIEDEQDKQTEQTTESKRGTSRSK
jgi:hypothetical protein